MRTSIAVLALTGILAMPGAAGAQSRTTLGVGSGAVAGALVGGPIGAVAGAVVGGFVGNASERGRRHVRRNRRYGLVRRAPQRRAEAEISRPSAMVARAPVPTTWKDPH